MLMKIKRGQNIIFYVSLLRIISLIHMKRVSGVKASPSNIQKAKKSSKHINFWTQFEAPVLISTSLPAENKAHNKQLSYENGCNLILLY